MLFVVLTLAQFVACCFGGGKILLFHETKGNYTVIEGQQVSLRCRSSGSVFIRLVDTMQDHREVILVNNSTLMGDYNGSYTFNFSKNGTHMTNDLKIREVKRELNGSVFRCIDIPTFHPQELSLTVLYSPRPNNSQCLSINNYLTPCDNQTGEPFSLTCISEEGNLKISLLFNNSQVDVHNNCIKHEINNTHRSAIINLELYMNCNNSMFACYVSQSLSTSLYNYGCNCSFQQIKILENLTIAGNDQNLTFNERKCVILSCESKVIEACKEWKIKAFSTGVYCTFSRNLTLGSNLGVNFTHTTRDTLIIVCCLVSPCDRNTNKSKRADISPTASDRDANTPTVAVADSSVNTERLGTSYILPVSVIILVLSLCSVCFSYYRMKTFHRPQTEEIHPEARDTDRADEDETEPTNGRNERRDIVTSHQLLDDNSETSQGNDPSLYQVYPQDADNHTCLMVTNSAYEEVTSINHDPERQSHVSLHLGNRSIQFIGGHEGETNIRCQPGEFYSFAEAFPQKMFHNMVYDFNSSINTASNRKFRAKPSNNPLPNDHTEMSLFTKSSPGVSHPNAADDRHSVCLMLKNSGYESIDEINPCAVDKNTKRQYLRYHPEDQNEQDLKRDSGESIAAKRHSEIYSAIPEDSDYMEEMVTIMVDNATYIPCSVVAP